MIEVKSCAYCDKEFSPSCRADKKFCNESCSKKYAVRKKQEQEKEQQREQERRNQMERQRQQQKVSQQEPELYEAEVIENKTSESTVHMTKNLNNHKVSQTANQTINQMDLQMNRIESLGEIRNTQIENCQLKIDDCHKILSELEVKKYDLEEWLSKNKEPFVYSIKTFINKYGGAEYYAELAQAHQINRHQGGRLSNLQVDDACCDFLAKKEQFSTKYYAYRAEVIAKHQTEVDFYKRKVFENQQEKKKMEIKLKDYQLEIDTLRKDFADLKRIYLDILAKRNKKDNPAPPTASNSANKPTNETKNVQIIPSPLPKAIRIEDLTFEKVRLQGYGIILGNFYNNKSFIFLKGLPGAGKTTFSFNLLKSFDHAGLKCAYALLETGLSPEVVKMAMDRNLTSSKVDYFDNLSLECLRAECIRGKHNVYFIDSWQKLNADSKEIDRLRNDFPKIIFVAISQVTNEGRIKGGQALYHDATAIIEIRQNGAAREAFIEKTRYGNQNKIFKLTS